MKRENQKPRSLHRPGRFGEPAPRADLPTGNASRPAGGTILHPTDYTESSRQAFELASYIARDRGSRLIVLHVAEPVHVPSLGMAPLPSLPKGYRGAWESRLRLIQPRDANVRVEHRVEEGDVAAAILRVAHEVACDLIVVAGRERTWLGHLLARSVAEEVERKASCPVLRLNAQRPGSAVETSGGNPSGTEEVKPKVILHPTDFSQPARYAFEVACSLARASDSELIVAHVAHGSDLYCGSVYQDEIETALPRLLASAPTVQARWMLLMGDPAAEILGMQREGWCDLIVMGRRRPTGPRRLFGRSVSAKVRRKSPCPVVTVSVPPDRPFPVRSQTLMARATPASDTDSNGGDHGLMSNHPAPDGLLALRR